MKCGFSTKVTYAFLLQEHIQELNPFKPRKTKISSQLQIILLIGHQHLTKRSLVITLTVPLQSFFISFTITLNIVQHDHPSSNSTPSKAELHAEKLRYFVLKDHLQIPSPVQKKGSYCPVLQHFKVAHCRFVYLIYNFKNLKNIFQSERCPSRGARPLAAAHGPPSLSQPQRSTQKLCSNS